MHFENLLSKESSKMLTSVGGWTAETNCTLTHSVRSSLFTETLTSDVKQNSANVTATAAGNMQIKSELFSVQPGKQYKAFVWSGAESALATSVGLRFYSVDNTVLQDTANTFPTMQNNSWGGLAFTAEAPLNAVLADVYIKWDSASASQTATFTRPSVVKQNDMLSKWLQQMLENVPDYIIEADLAQGTDATGTSRPLMRYLTVATNQHHKIQDDIISWDFLHPSETSDGKPDNSALVDPYTAKAAWLPWLAQTLGVSLDTVPSGGRSPWLAFEQAGIDTWVEWEEDVDPASVPGTSDTEWSDIETFSPDFFNVDSARRIQIASGFNGVLGGTSESIVEYVGKLLNTEDEEPFVYVVKHYATNPYRILVSVLEIEDPDPKGDMLKRAVESAAPAGTDVVTEHGVTATAKSFYRIPDMFRHMWLDIDRGSTELNLRFLENTAANGRHLRLASLTGSTEPFMGGAVALARWFQGFALYSGAVRLETDADSSFNLLGDQDIRILVSDVTPPASGTLTLAKSDGKWEIAVDSNGYLQFSWENAGTQTVVSTDAPDWGNIDKGPFWLRITLDLNNDASGHTVTFSESPTLYEETWPTVGTAVVTSGVTSIDTSPTANIEVFENGTNPVNGASAIVYRVMLHNGIDGTLAADLNMLGEFTFPDSTAPHTGTTFWRLPISNIAVNVYPVADGATNLVESRWVTNNHAGADDYFYLGKSPHADDSGNPTGLGDTLTVSGLTTGDYEWTMTLLDGSTIVNTVTSATSITFDTDDYGGNSIVNIIVRTDPGGVVAALFTPDLLSGSTTTQSDTYGKTWTLTRAFTTSHYYEYSAFHDRDSVSAYHSDGAFTSTVTFDADEPLSVAVDVRRFWSGSGTTVIADHTTTSGWKIQYNGDNIEAIITNGTSPLTLTYDEVTNNRLGQFNLVVLRRDIVNAEVTLWVNGAKVDSAADPYSTGALFTTVGDTGVLGDSASVNKFDVRYFGIFDRSLPDSAITHLADEVSRLVQVLPQASQTINAPILVNSSTVFTPGFGLVAWDITPALLDASPTLYAPQTNQTVLSGYISTGHTVHTPTSVSIV